MKHEREKAIKRGLELAWESLDSHLPYLYKPYKPSIEGKNWHKRCVKDYCELIYILGKLL